MAKFKMAEFKMAAIIKLSQNEWVKYFLCKCWEIILASVSEFERTHQNGWIQDGGIQVGRIQDGCYHQVESEGMSEVFLCRMAESKMAEFKMEEFNLAAIIKLITLNYFESESEWRKSVFEWIWEKITRCLNPRWQCLNPTWQIQDGCHHQVEWEWMSEAFLWKMAESKMATIIKLSQYEWLWVRLN